MKAVGYRTCLPIIDPNSLVDLELPEPAATGCDLLVRVEAVSVNPVDTKVRRNMPTGDSGVRVLGYDAAGVVQAVGSNVSLFKPGDQVWYAGSRVRSGTNAQLHLVDERIVGRKPKSLSFAQAAAMPLTTITAWEALFDRLGLPIVRPSAAAAADACAINACAINDSLDPSAGTVLITAGAGGVGSIAIQLARRLSRARVVATASRPESRAQAERLGAHLVLDHREPLSAALQTAGVRWAERIFSISYTHVHTLRFSDCRHGRAGSLA